MSEAGQSGQLPSTSTGEESNIKTNKNTYKQKSKYDGGKKKRSEDNRKSKFVGETPEMLGHVFQVHSEQRTRGQFQDTMDQLKIYASTNYKKEIKHMRKLFTDIETPQVSRPIKTPKVTQRRTETGVTTRGQRQSVEVVAMSTEDEGSDDNIEAAIYAEEVKTYVKEKRIL